MPMAVSNTSSVVGASHTMEKKDAVAPPPPTSSSAWEDMEYGGLQLGPLPHGVLVKNTFIECPNARSISLDEEAESRRGWKSCPNSGIMMGEPTQPPISEMQSLVIPEGLEGEGSSSSASVQGDKQSEQSEEKEAGELPEGLILKNTFIDYPTERSSSLDEYFDEKGWKSCPVSRMQSEAENQVSEIQASVIAEGKEDEQSGSEKEEEVPTTLKLLDLLPRPEPVLSVGSLSHQLGQPCKPCGFVHKPEGCTNGASCQYCHLCPPGTIKQRKKVKKVILRQTWQHRAGGQGWF